MKNVATKVEGNMLWVGIDLTQKQGPTKSGKGTTLAATEGYRNVPGAPNLGLNLHVYERDVKAS